MREHGKDIIKRREIQRAVPTREVMCAPVLGFIWENL
jgi:hypothetical protein